MVVGRSKKNGNKCGNLSRRAYSAASTKCRKARVGLDGDFFLNAQGVDPEWGKNVAVSNYYLGKTMSKLGVILTGRKLGDRQFEVKVLFQEGAWKIDEVKFSD